MEEHVKGPQEPPAALTPAIRRWSWLGSRLSRGLLAAAGGTTDLQDEIKGLKEPLEALTLGIRRSNSLGWSFLRGLATAVGGTVGLAALLTIAIYALAHVPQTNAVGRFLHDIASIIDRAKR